MTVQALLSQIRAALGGLTHSLTAASSASDLYEAYIYSLAIEAARREGASVSFLDVNGRPASPFVFRTSPGHIGSRRRDYGYAALQFSQKPPLEAHVSVRATGRSRVPHECDVLILDASEATLCREVTSFSAYPRARYVCIAVECKYYTSPLKLGLAREFLGLGSEFGTGAAIFVTNSSSSSVEKLLTHQKREWDHRIAPGNRTDVERLRNTFQRKFQRYKAKH